MSDPIKCDVNDHGIATVILNRPEHLNAINKPMALELLHTTQRLSVDPRVRVVVLTGAGPAFCAGGDLHEEPAESVLGSGPEDEMAGRLRAVMRTTELIRGMPKVTIAAVNGACVGAGLALACAADMRIASTTARFATRFLSVGLSGDFGGTWLLPRVIGEAKAREMYLLDDIIDAKEAHRIGLVNSCAAPNDLEVAVSEVARRAALQPENASRLTKANLNDNVDCSLTEAMDREALRIVECLSGDEPLAARASFWARHRRSVSD